ncbi:MAG: alpha/beta fold hydrolase [Spirochaetales bacterium]|nr:alpha/beta fold hydrolase [Leptospiraceae bacterium]MCP5482687.1 alpha/beta fold hydrolase [Spirochaetales bacterium]MCP5485069.1 alpha/beta fold hydrolase [Spirochaetales bacterium]
MPLIEKSSYRPPVLFRDAHLQTMYPYAFRFVRGVRYRRERIRTPDGDFLDLDWCDGSSARPGRVHENLVVVSHGLEANTRWSYIRGMVRAFFRAGFDVLAWNYRGCSGHDNLAFGSYHAGVTQDLETVLVHADRRHRYRNIVLVGFSLGANLTLKYLGEKADNLDPRIKRAVTFSAPLDLESCSRVLSQPANRVYMDKFLRSLRGKVKAKSKRYPGRIDERALKRMRTFREFDDFYTAPAHGFQDAEDYWRRASSIRLLKYIRIPTLLVSAQDDPFLGPECYPVGEAIDHEYFFFEAPRYGGHVGFVSFNRSGLYWSEQRAVDFVRGRIFR